MAYAMDPYSRGIYQKTIPECPPEAWRSVANSRHAFVVESFMDEMAAAGGKDPLQTSAGIF